MPDPETQQRIELWMDRELVEQMDEAAGPFSRADFIRLAVQRAIDDAVRVTLEPRAPV